MVISWYTVTLTLSNSLGMVLGGLLLKFMTWRSIFLCNFPLVLVVLPFAYLALPNENDPLKDMAERSPRLSSPKSDAEDDDDIALEPVEVKVEKGEEDHHQGAPEQLQAAKPPFDWGGSVMLSLCFGALLLGLNRAGPWGWDSRPVLLLLGGGILLIPMFGLDQHRKGRNAILPPIFVSDPLMLVTIAMKLILVAVYNIAFILLPYYLQEAKGWTPDGAAQLLMVRPLVFSLSSWFVGKTCQSLLSSAKMIIAGIVVFSAGVLVLTTCLELHWAFTIVGVCLQGCGAGMLFPTLATASYSRVSAEDMGVFNGFSGVLDALSTCAGQAVIISAVQSFGGMQDPHAYVSAFQCTVPFTLLPLAMSFHLFYLVFNLPTEEGGLGGDWQAASHENQATKGAQAGREKNRFACYCFLAWDHPAGFASCNTDEEVEEEPVQHDKPLK